MNSIHINFHKTPNKIYELGLSASELLVLTYLCSLSNNPTIHPSKKTMASKTKLSKRTIDKAIKSLVIKGFLEYNRGFAKGTRQMCNRYRIRIEKIDPTCVNKSSKQIEQEEPGLLECSEMINENYS